MSRAQRIALSGLVVIVLVAGFVLPAAAQNVSGTIFEDRNANGLHDPGEPVLSGVDVRLYGSQDAGPSLDLQLATGSDGAYAFSAENGCFLVAPTDPAGWRAAPTRFDGFAPGSPGYSQPAGVPRFSKLDRLIDHLAAGNVRYSALGDSIAFNFNLCGYPERFWYSKRLRDRLSCVAPGATVTLDEGAIKGETTDDLLVDDTGELNNVFRLIEANPQLVSISIIGNDLLDVDPGTSFDQLETNIAVEEVLDARQNLQEVLSTILTELPDADVTLNSLYDNEAYDCEPGDSTLFHREWIPIVNRILREMAWGQSRRVAINEVAAEFANEDQQNDCTGFEGLICRDLFRLDTIHPTNGGYDVVLEKVWEAAGGVAPGPNDIANRAAFNDVDFGYLRRVRRLYPTTATALSGAAVVTPEAAFSEGDDAVASISLGAGSEEVRFGGFPDWFDEIEVVKVVAGVRYATSGTVTDDLYRIEASTNDVFRAPPGHAYTPTDWDFYTPLVGGGGPNAPATGPDYGNAELLARPDVPVAREATATLTKNPILPQGGAEYVWPPLTHDELGTSQIRVASAPVGLTSGNDGYAVEVDAVWLDVYGWERTRPAEVTNLRVDPDGLGRLALRFDDLPGASRYNVYAGRLDALPNGYDHGASAPAGPFCDRPTALDTTRRTALLDFSDVPGGSTYFLVTAHVDDIESPAGFDSGATEIDRAQSSCQ